MMPVYAEQIESGISIINVSSEEDDRVVYMDATIETFLPTYMTEAIYNGVPLPLLLQIEVKESYDWWFDRSLVTVEQHYVLHYYPLLDSVRLNNLSSGSSTVQSSIAASLKKVGSIKHFPILDKEHFNTDNALYARVRLKVDVSSLPQPLRTEALLGGNWDISSDWKEWLL